MSTTLEEQKNLERILSENFDKFIAYANNTFVKKEEFERKFAHLDQEQMQIKIDVEVIKQTMATKADIAEMKTEISKEIFKIKTELLKWTISLFAGAILSNVGFMLAVFLKS
jgi:hypothetical protein